MPLEPQLSNLEEQIVAALARPVAGDWQLFYEAGFADGDLAPVIDPLSLGPLKMIWTDAVPPNYRLPEVLPTYGVRLTVELPANTAGNAAVALVVPQFPDAHTDIFAIRAHFKYPTGPSEPIGQLETDNYAWAPLVIAGKEDLRLETRALRIGVSLQASYDFFGTSGHPAGPGARMNTVGGSAPIALGKCPPPPYAAGSGAGDWIPKNIYDQVYSSDANVSIECFVDRGEVIGIASLKTFWVPAPSPGNPLPMPITYAEARRFCHPFIWRTNPSTNETNVIDVAGFALAVGRGIGPASVTLTALQMYRLVRYRDIHEQFLSAVQSLFGPSFEQRALGRFRAAVIERVFENLPR
jgi:hypothetical protein